MPLTERQQMALLLEMSAKEFQEQKKEKTKKSGEGSGSKRSISSSKRDILKINKRNKRGETQLHLASIKGDVDGVKGLIKKGADVNITDYAGWTPLHEACSRGHYPIAKILLKAGADVNAKGLEDDTPLHDASSNGHLKIARILLKYGADPTRRNDSLENPLDVSASSDIDALLEEFSSFTETERENYAFSEDSSPESSSDDDMSSVKSSDIDLVHGKTGSYSKEKSDHNDNFNEDNDNEDDEDNEDTFTPHKRRAKVSRVSNLAQKRIVSDEDDDSDDDDMELSRISEIVKRKRLAMAEELEKAKVAVPTEVIEKVDGTRDVISTPKDARSGEKEATRPTENCFDTEVTEKDDCTREESKLISTPKVARSGKREETLTGEKLFDAGLKKMKRKRKQSEKDAENVVPNKKGHHTHTKVTSSSKERCDKNVCTDLEVEKAEKRKIESNSTDEKGTRDVNVVEDIDKVDRVEEQASKKETLEQDDNSAKEYCTQPIDNNPYISDISDADDEEDVPHKNNDKITSDMFRANIFTNALDRLSDQSPINEPQLSSGTQSDVGMSDGNMDAESGRSSNRTTGEKTSSSISVAEIKGSLTNSCGDVFDTGLQCKEEKHCLKIETEPKKEIPEDGHILPSEKSISGQDKKSLLSEDGSLSFDSVVDFSRKGERNSSKLVGSLDDSVVDVSKRKKDKKHRKRSSSTENVLEIEKQSKRKLIDVPVVKDTTSAADKNIKQNRVSVGVRTEDLEQKAAKKAKKKKLFAKLVGDSKKPSAQAFGKTKFNEKNQEKNNAARHGGNDGGEAFVFSKSDFADNEIGTKDENEDIKPVVLTAKQKGIKDKGLNLSPKSSWCEPLEVKTDVKGKESKSMASGSKKKYKNAEQPQQNKVELSATKEEKQINVVEVTPDKVKDSKRDRPVPAVSKGGIASNLLKEHGDKLKAGEEHPKKAKNASNKPEKIARTKDSNRDHPKDSKRSFPDTDPESQASSPEKIQKSSQFKKTPVKSKDGKSDFKKDHELLGRESEKASFKENKKGKELTDTKCETNRDGKMNVGDGSAKSSPMKDARTGSSKDQKTTPVKGRRESKEVDLKIWDFGLQIIAPPKIIKSAKSKEQRKAQSRENKAKREAEMQHGIEKSKAEKKVEAPGTANQSSQDESDNKGPQPREAVDECKKDLSKVLSADKTVAKPGKGGNKKLVQGKNLDDDKSLEISQPGEKVCQASFVLPVEEDVKATGKDISSPKEITSVDSSSGDVAKGDSRIEPGPAGKADSDAINAVSLDSPLNLQKKFEITPVDRDAHELVSVKEESPMTSCEHLDKDGDERLKTDNAINEKSVGKPNTDQICNEKVTDRVEYNAHTEETAKILPEEGDPRTEEDDNSLLLVDRLDDFGTGSDLEDHLGPYHGTKLEETDIDIKEISHPEDTLKMLTQGMRRREEGAAMEDEIKENDFQNVKMTGHDFTILSEKINEKIQHLSSRSFVSELSEEEKHIVNISMEIADNLSQDGDERDAGLREEEKEDSIAEESTREALSDSMNENCASPLDDVSKIEGPNLGPEDHSISKSVEDANTVLSANNLSTEPNDKPENEEKPVVSEHGMPAVVKTSVSLGSTQRSSLESSQETESVRAPSTRPRIVDLEPRGIAQVVADIDLNSISHCILEAGKPSQNAPSTLESETSTQAPTTLGISGVSTNDLSLPKEPESAFPQESSSKERLKKKAISLGHTSTWRKALFNDYEFSNTCLPENFKNFSLIRGDYWQTDSTSREMEDDITEDNEIKQLKEEHSVELKRLHLCMEQELIRVESRYKLTSKVKKPISACSAIMYQKLEQYSKLSAKNNKKSQDESDAEIEEQRRRCIREVLDKFIKKEDEMQNRHEQELVSLDHRLSFDKMHQLDREDIIRKKYFPAHRLHSVIYS